MKRLTTLLMTLMLMSAALWADEKITVSANSSDISEGLDLKVVAKLFAEAKNLEEFETMLNDPDSAFCNLDLNGDGQVDYLRVVETGEGNKRLIVLQAVLAKDIYQDVASIYVEKDEKEQVSVQIVGDEYVYGTNYIIEPVYVYRPVIYDWFWSTAWVAWYSPWYWGYYPGWWRVHTCWAHDWYWHHCYAFHHHHHSCSFRPGRTIHSGYHELSPGVSRREYATANPDRSFSNRNAGMTNARDIRNAGGATRRSTEFGSSRSGEAGQRGAGVTERGAGTHTVTTRSTGATRREGDTFSRTFGSRNTAETRRVDATTRRADATTRSESTTRSTTATTRSTTATTRSATATTHSASTTRSTATTQRVTPTAQTTQRPSVNTTQRSTATTQRSSAVTQRTPSMNYSSGTTSRSTGGYSSSSRSSGSSFSGSSSSRSSGSSFSGSSSSRSSSGGGTSHRR